MIQLHQFAQSPFCDKVRRILHWKGVTYRTINVPRAQAPTELPRLTPTSKVPVLELEGRRLSDSSDIARQLESTYPDPPLWPADVRQRSLCHFLEDWADESLYFYHLRLSYTFPHNARRLVPELMSADGAVLGRLAELVVPGALRAQLHQQGLGRKPEAMVVQDLRQHLRSVSGWLDGQQWLVGERLSIADISVFAQLSAIGRTDEGERLLEQHPEVVAWMARVDDCTAGG